MRSAAFATWQRMGLEVVLVDGHSMGRYEDLADEFWAFDARDKSADLERIVPIARTCQGVTTLSDDSQHTAALIAAECGWPGTGPAAAAAARSKAQQRSLCQQAGMQVPRWRTVRKLSDISEFFGDRAWPAVIKPVDSAGGAGALRVAGPDEAGRHWPIVRSLSPSRTAVIEDYIPAHREVCVDAVVVGPVVHFISVVECEHMNSVGFLCTSASYSTAQPDQRIATSLVRQIVSALDVGHGIVHAEFRINGDHWTMVETGLRPGGAFVPELTVRVSGVDLYEAQARLALGVSPPVPAARPPEAPYAQARYLVAEGQVRSFVPPAVILAELPDVRVVNQQAAAGQHMRVPLSEAGRAGYAFGWGRDRDQLDAQLRTAIDRLGQEMGLTVRHDEPDVPRRRAWPRSHPVSTPTAVTRS
jgi:biotin carboxylase